MLKIGDFSRISQVTIKTLRYYDRLDLLKPAQVDKFTGHRYYTMSQLPFLNRILALKDMGLSLNEVKQLVDEELSPLEIKGMFRLKRVQLHQELEIIQARLQRIDTYMNQIEENNMPEYEVTVKSVSAQKVLAIREVVPSSDDIAPLFEEIGEKLKDNNIEANGAWIALYHHQGFRDVNLDIEIAVPVSTNMKEIVLLEDNRQLEVREMMSYEQVASVLENGHNEDWSGGYNALGQFIENNHYEIGGAIREIYLTAPDSDDGWLVEIQFPLKAK